MLNELQSIDQDLARICRKLPQPIFEQGSDRPLNSAARIYGLLAATRQDELASAIASLRQALRMSDETPDVH
jgi:hypothetical protein